MWRTAWRTAWHIFKIKFTGGRADLSLGSMWHTRDTRVTYAWHTFFYQISACKSAYVTRMSCVCHAYVTTSRKSFSDFYENLQKWSLDRKNLPYFGKSAKNFFLPEKNPTSSFKIRGILKKKMFRKFLETSVKISL